MLLCNQFLPRDLKPDLPQDLPQKVQAKVQARFAAKVYMSVRPIHIYADACHQYGKAFDIPERLRLLAQIKNQVYAYVLSILAYDDVMDHLLPCSNAVFAANIHIGTMFTAYQSAGQKEINIAPHLKTLYDDLQKATQSYQTTPCRSAIIDIEWAIRQFCRLVVFIASIAKKYISRTVAIVQQITTYINDHRLGDLLQSQQLVV